MKKQNFLAAASLVTIAIQITQKGVYDDEGERVPVGKEIEIGTQDGNLPAFLKGKCKIVSVEGEPVKTNVPLTNPKKGGNSDDDNSFDDTDLSQINGIGKATAKARGQRSY